MRFGGLDFREVWLVDFEFHAPPGELPTPVCAVAWELATGRKLRLWEDDLLACKGPPYSTSSDSLFVAYYASAEFGCHLGLSWPLPEAVLDLYVEFRNLTNGKPPPCGNGLLGALNWFALDSIAAAEKEEMRELSMRGGPWTAAEKTALLDYCESDVEALHRLLPKMMPTIDLPRALLRGRYMKAAARIEHTAVPIDVEALALLRENWPALKTRLIEHVDRSYGVYDGTIFKSDRFVQWLTARGMPWPVLPSGSAALDDDTFKMMAQTYPEVQPLRQLRDTMSKLHAFDLPVGSDGRNRCLLSAFSSRTGRNQPQTSKFIFGFPSWLRGLIRPGPGYGLAYIDWSQQEIGIAAALSGDPALITAYESGDPYLSFAKQAGAIPPNGSKATHAGVREQYKACFLAVGYGMGAESLARRIAQPVARARELLRMHRETYRRFWKWSGDVVDYASLNGKLYTALGWETQVEPEFNSRSLSNFPMQANGAEMLRLACCLATEQGIRVCAPVHDAILIEAPAEEIEAIVALTQEAMAQASGIVLGGFRLRSDAKIVCHPDRYEDERGKEMWETVWQLLAEITAAATAAPPTETSERDCNITVTLPHTCPL